MGRSYLDENRFEGREVEEGATVQCFTECGTGGQRSQADTVYRIRPAHFQANGRIFWCCLVESAVSLQHPLVARRTPLHRLVAA